MAQSHRPEHQPANPDEGGYNGWTNYETWCVNLWLTNDQESYEATRELVQRSHNPYEAAQALRDWVEDTNPLQDQATVFTDLLNAALSEVNWHEIATHFVEE
jgi:hypothetical protein